MTNKPTYQWIPRNGISHEAVERIRSHFRKPNYPMGEAWFMSQERRLYTELDGRIPLKSIEDADLAEILFEISSGTKFFGHREEWDQWFRYLLADLIADKQQLLPEIVTAFMCIFWKGIPEEYEGFRSDVINSLSLCLMKEALWFDYVDESTGEAVKRAVYLDKYEDGAGNLRLGWNSGQAEENLSAMMFFCLKYLEPGEIITWVESLFAISDVYWKGALMVWILGAYDILQKPVVVPSEIDKANPEIKWEFSHLLGSSYGSMDAKYPPDDECNDNKDFLPAENVRVFSEEIRRYLTPEMILEAAESFSKDKFAAESTYNVPELLLDKFYDKNKSPSR